MQKLEWFSPRWSSAPQQWRALRKHILSSGPIARIAISSLVSIVAIILIFKWLFPGLIIPNLLPVVFILPSLLIMMTLQTWMLAACRTKTVIKPKLIQVTHGNSSLIIKRESLLHTKISLHDNDRIRLSIYYQKKNRLRRKTVGVPPEISFEALKQALNVPTKVKDYRGLARVKLATIRTLNA